ncbi:hypothetical protein IU433_30345 [Nocardia puris]|uniref:Uncharacterized protein n=1 Tax=Nocardia puris TaxID=208602 RepID=A0A366E2R4_9NOCA|nr:DUF6670 family protein [Nocardia puris]MBF6215455.1 hypothetical protein [Nocardia puris]MBF6369105.1 hypothetical protein [Nocardia puris]MBF6463306.1 hypothetical protein [Nocardia puris]RBO96660.1 hypothetical protein DFR74_101676 [Nocardia puris]
MSSNPVPDRQHGLLGSATRFVVDHIRPRIDRRLRASTRPFTRPEMMRPHHDSRRFWTHYGVFVPDLPAPHRYLNTMTLIGPTGTMIFDNDHLAAPDVRDTATVLSSTAHNDQYHYRAYNIATECRFAPDGSALEWGSDLSITRDHPAYTVRGRYEHFGVDLAITATDQVSWFVRSRVYDHFSLLATYTGTLTDATGVTEIGGLCTVEYARSISPQAFSQRPLPERYKLPADFFTYQIIDLDERNQLLLTEVRAAGAVACRLAYLRTIGGSARVFEDVTFEVLAHRDEPAVDELGRQMRVPARMRWTVRDGGADLLALEAEVDTPLRWGHGRGYVGAYSYSGSWSGRAISGSGYLEWVDCEPSPA